MVVSLRKLTKASIADFETRPRHEWATLHASQVGKVVLVVLLYYFLHTPIGGFNCVPDNVV